MISLRSKSIRLLVILVFAIILAAAVYGFADANTFSGGATIGRLGEGSGSLSGYDVTGVQFKLDTNNPHQITEVKFTLNNNATEAQVSLDGSTWETCAGGPTDWTCTLGTAVSVSAVTSMDVFATDQTTY